MADLYGRSIARIDAPLTADQAIIGWGPAEGAAVQVSIAYQQQVNRRRTIGNTAAVIWASMPQGQITIARLMVPSTIIGGEGFDPCQPATITLTLAGCSSDGGAVVSKPGPKYTARGCIVSQYSVSAEAESLTVMDNMQIDFLTLEA
jgi:hypothetical protein